MIVNTILAILFITGAIIFIGPGLSSDSSCLPYTITGLVLVLTSIAIYFLCRSISGKNSFASKNKNGRKLDNPIQKLKSKD